MIVLDTNVVSQAMKPQPHPVVVAWLNAQAYAQGGLVKPIACFALLVSEKA